MLDKTPKERRFIVYKITNIVNQKIYFGITCRSLQKRWNQHKCSASRDKRRYYIHAAIRKYGHENFKIEEIYNNISECDAQYHERRLIKENNTMQNSIGYNRTGGGETAGGYLVSEITRKKISEAAKKRKYSPEYRKIMSERQKERWKNQDYRQNIIDKMKAISSTHEQRQKFRDMRSRSNCGLGLKRSEEWKRKFKEQWHEKIGPSIIGKLVPQERRDKISLANKGKKRTIEVRKKISLSLIGRPCSDETRRKRGASIKAAWDRKKSIADN